MRRRRWSLAALLVAFGAVAGVAIDRHGAPWIPVGPEAHVPPPNLDFSIMAIATRPVDATESRGTEKVRVKSWERCALGYATCNEPGPRTVEAVCLGSGRTVLINEKDWPAFQRTPDDDLKGIENVPKDMKLCATWDQ